MWQLVSLCPNSATFPRHVLWPELIVLKHSPSSSEVWLRHPQWAGQAHEQPQGATRSVIPVLPLREAGCPCQSPLPTAPQFPSLPIHSQKARARVQRAWNSTRGLSTFKDVSAGPGVKATCPLHSWRRPHDPQTRFPPTPWALATSGDHLAKKAKDRSSPSLWRLLIDQKSSPWNFFKNLYITTYLDNIVRV